MYVEQYFISEREGKIKMLKIRVGNFFLWCCDGSDLDITWVVLFTNIVCKNCGNSQYPDDMNWNYSRIMATFTNDHGYQPERKGHNPSTSKWGRQ